jgi:molecular chaperone GrpE
MYSKNLQEKKRMTDTSQAPDAPANENAAPEQVATPELVAALTQMNAEIRDQLLRTLADMENLRKRTERDVADARTYGIASFARDAIGAADNIRRALDATGVEWKAQADAAGQALFDGVELTEREFLKVLEKHGVRKLDPLGQKFDPNLHQAMFELPDPSVPAGTIVQVLQSGFVIGDRILRPALVGVAKGGPKPGAAEPSPSDNAAEQ